VPETVTAPPPAEPAAQERYHTSQLIAHWLIVMLVLMQFLMNEGMSRSFWASVDLGERVVTGGTLVHAFGGATILVVMLVRLWLRRAHGAPPPPPTAPRWMQIVSRANHYAFYVVLIAMPLVGAAALLTLQPWLAILHAWTGYLLLALIAAHLAGAFWHAFKRDGTIARIAQPDPAHDELLDEASPRA
jgi:cytochrome b561